MRPINAFFAVLVVSLCACGRVVPRVNYTGTGVADPIDDARMDAVLQRALRLPPKERKNVTVLIDQFPRGMRLEGNTPVIDDNAGVEMVGKFDLEARTSNFFFIAKFIDYADVWRKALCWWQVPLEWLTLGVWSVVPTSWACFPARPYLQKEDAVAYIQSLAYAANADVVVMTYDRESRETVRSARGWLLRTIQNRQLVEPLPPPPPPSPNP